MKKTTTHQKKTWMQGWGGRLIMGLILVGFVGTSGSYLVATHVFSNHEDPVLAKYSGGTIHLNETRHALARLQESQPQLFEQALTMKPLQAVIVRRTLTGLWETKLINAYFNDSLHLDDASDDLALRIIAQAPIFQDENGSFSRAKFSQFLIQTGQTEHEILKQVLQQQKSDLATQMFFDALPSSLESAQALYAVYNQTRDVRIWNVPTQALKKSIRAQIKPEDLSAYHSGNPSFWSEKAKARFQYIRLEAPQFSNPTDEEIRPYYDAWLQGNQTQEKDRVLVLKTENSLQNQAAIEEAIQTKKIDFSVLALRYSEDELSLSKGGEVDDWSRFPKEVTDQLKSLESDETSKKPVQVAGAFYYVHKAPVVHVLSFEAMKKNKQLLVLWQEDQRLQWLNSKLDAMSKALDDSLDMSAIAQELGVKSVETTWIAVGDAPKGLSGFSHDVFAQQAASQLVQNNDISQPFALNEEGSSYMLLQKIDAQPAKLKPLASVRSDVLDRLTQTRLQQTLQAELKRITSQTQSASALQKELQKLTQQALPTSKNYPKLSRYDDESDLNGALIDSVFSMEKSGFSFIPLQDGGYRVFQIRGIHNPDLNNIPEEEKEAFLANPLLSQSAAKAALQLILQPLRKKNPLHIDEELVHQINLSAGG